jgi:NTP pyrophosphatase (non-canonical NTP hydrolase)
MIDYNKFKHEVHALAVEKGWYDTERQWNELVLLVQSEVFEAFECWRKNKLEAEYEIDGKPIGLPSEMADIVIRLLDMAGYYDIYIEKVDDQLLIDVDDFINWCYTMINEGVFGREEFIFYFIADVENMCNHMNIDLQKVIVEKHEYNKTRPYRHGNKRA